MIVRSFLVAGAMLAASIPALAGNDATPRHAVLASTAAIPTPVLRGRVDLTGDVVRIGDLVDNAGKAAQIAIYRSPDPGTTGTLPATQVLDILRAHQVIGVDTHGLRNVAVTRLARTLEPDDVELQIAVALEHRNGLGDAKDLLLTFDKDLTTIHLDAANNGAINPVVTRFDPRKGRFDVTLEIGNDSGAAPTRLRFTGVAVETVEAAVLARDVDRHTLLKFSDVVMERRPKAEVGRDAASHDHVVGMQTRRQMRAGQALHGADLTRPDLVQRDEAVTLIYQAAGIYLTVRGKATEAGTEGDVVSVLNLQSKRTVSGVVVGRGQVSVSPAAPVAPRRLASAEPAEATASISPRSGATASSEAE
ncbi:Flageller protein FlgA [Nitrobacter sp. Nb-311A]|uniref:flagellar basal body P-ring formation chaperone FlgA n=1 Tax=unclassified Nitrobacter TaxID=2620411 RepID=UPI0000686598|nr:MULTISPECIES: flagellar basal body P-ring formation chaperone FlgA [unclassified Nitrobacter]EAQ36120.1 Flageller protein FlgA [Nitrobacter sp. Nb-311A]MCB1393869.1 flagellar basal body P-ring formation protein FlgA [Nitrobacter sp.]MCV0387455.1 flagellar basal body P-ring formation protein FlgA [Nitrobacter sp.]